MMRIHLFGVLAELAGAACIEIRPCRNIEGLKKEVFQHYPALANQDFSIAVNNILVTEDSMPEDILSLAFLPPFSGG
ncbi:MAG: MoaD/ThiS family protein [Chitinophagaceae bacterium]|nr:MoaD/ThiS family protein [Chitinophagaceae bacterium]